MNVISLPLYILSVISVISTLYVCYGLYRRFRLFYLLYFVYFISAFFVAGFIDLVGSRLAAAMLSGQDYYNIVLLHYIFAFLVFPIIPLAVYFLFLFIEGLTEQRSPRYPRHVYAAFWILFFLVFVVSAKNFLSNRDAGVSRYLFAALYTVSYLFYCAVPTWGLVSSLRLEDGGRRRVVRILCLIMLCGFVLSWIVSGRSSGYASATKPLYILVYFSINLPPLLYIRRHLSRFPPAPETAPPMEDADLEGFYERFGLSKREREIVSLMLTGKSNKEIAAELFVSTHTVKNHVYNIYQKLRVSNRLHFIRVVQNHAQSKAE